MPEEHMDVMEQMQKMGEKWTEFKKTMVMHFKDMEWNFGVGKADKAYVIDFKAKVSVKPKSK